MRIPHSQEEQRSYLKLNAACIEFYKLLVISASVATATVSMDVFIQRLQLGLSSKTPFGGNQNWAWMRFAVSTELARAWLMSTKTGIVRSKIVTTQKSEQEANESSPSKNARALFTNAGLAAIETVLTNYPRVQKELATLEINVPEFVPPSTKYWQTRWNIACAGADLSFTKSFVFLSAFTTMGIAKEAMTQYIPEKAADFASTALVTAPVSIFGNACDVVRTGMLREIKSDGRVPSAISIFKNLCKENSSSVFTRGLFMTSVRTGIVMQVVVKSAVLADETAPKIQQGFRAISRFFQVDEKQPSVPVNATENNRPSI